jgi:dipeptidase E
MHRRLLLISNSTNFGRGYLEHCEAEIGEILGDASHVLFVPYALKDHDGYASTAAKRFSVMGYELRSVHAESDPVAAAQAAPAFFVGGGNTFRLLDCLYRFGLLEAIRDRVHAGAVYMGSSAGTNVACVSIRTTNDMPIVQPPSFEALNLLPFNINPHYLDPAPDSKHMGETRETRIREFHEENEPAVVGLREGGMLLVRDSGITLKGAGARLFRRGEPPREFQPGDRLDFLLT